MNTIISIGYIGIKRCYLNISKDEAIERYCKSENMAKEEFEDSDLEPEEINFVDEFSAYEIFES